MTELFEWQQAALDGEAGVAAEKMRCCLYFKTGAGKTRTGLELVKQAGHTEALVITPPSTYAQWVQAGQAMDIDVQPMSHAKFRMKDTKLRRDQAVIADEFHMFGGHGKTGWTKLDRLAKGVQAPVILMSATPNYNDADRVYCIQHILDPHGTKGGYLQFLNDHCNTAVNPFGMVPLVDDERPFKLFKDAAEYLAALPHVYYLPDDLDYTIEDLGVPEKIFPEMDKFGYDKARHRIIASGIEEKHQRIFLNLVDDRGRLEAAAYREILGVLGKHKGPLLIFCAHSTVAVAADAVLGRSFKTGLVTGDTPKKKKAERIAAFNDGVLEVLIGTATLATGTDGMDKVCDTLMILDDTEDDAQRRQLIGRIMPRGSDVDATRKKVYRLVLTP